MRTHHVIAIVAVLVVGVVAKQFFFPPIKAEADISHTVSMNVGDIQNGMKLETLSAPKLNDRTFVFDRH